MMIRTNVAPPSPLSCSLGFSDPQANPLYCFLGFFPGELLADVRYEDNEFSELSPPPPSSLTFF